MSNIVISGYYGSKNAGDEAMLAAMIEILSDLAPRIKITVISADPADTRQRHGVEAVSWLDARAIFSSLKQADLLLSGGGSLLQNITSRRSLYYYMGIILLSFLAGTKVMLYAQGIGPIRGCIPRRIMKWLGNKVSLITVRDHGSLEELADLGITEPPIEATADPVLAIHPVDRGIGRTILRAYKADGARPTVGISVREWCGWQHYKKVVAAVAAQIEEEFGARIIFLPMQYPEDVRTAQKIAGLSSAEVTVLKDEYTTSELLSIVGNMDLLLSIRLHALIFAGVMGIPMIGMSYDPKIDRFLSDIGEKPAGNLKNVSVDGIMAEVRLKWHDKVGFKEKNAAKMSGLRLLAAKNAEYALGLIEIHKD